MWITAEANYKPNTVDIATSKVYNYIRRNIHQEQREDDEGKIYTVWVYEEKKISKENWELYKAVERNSANIDYIAMMTDVEIEEGEDDE